VGGFPFEDYRGEEMIAPTLATHESQEAKHSSPFRGHFFDHQQPAQLLVKRRLVYPQRQQPQDMESTLAVACLRVLLSMKREVNSDSSAQEVDFADCIQETAPSVEIALVPHFGGLYERRI